MRYRYFLRLLVIFLLTAYASLGRLQAQDGPEGLVPDSTELRVLRQFYYATGGPTWTNQTGWPQQTTLAAWLQMPMADVATWQGLWVQNGDVYGLVLQGNHLTGSLPASLGELRALRAIQVTGNQLTGPLPASLGQLSKLQGLYVGYNQFAGPLPASLGATDLREVSAQRNHFSGPLPASWGQLARLQSLYLENNELTGLIPTTYGGMTDMRALSLSHNLLSGPIPAQLGQLKQMTNLGLLGNRLSGPLPESFGRLTQLMVLDLRGNQLSGVLPDSIGQMQSLLSLLISYNQFSGALPASLLNTPVVEMYLEQNAFTSLPLFAYSPRAPLMVLYCHGNELDYSSIEANLTGPDQYPFFLFTYDAQRPRTPADRVQAVVGARAQLSRNLGGTHTHYQWERQVGQAWVEITGATDSLYIIAHAQEAHEGNYRVRGTNDWAPNAPLYSRTVLLDLLPYTPLLLNEPVTTGCPELLTALAPTQNRTGAHDSVNFVRTYVPRTAYTNATRLRQAGVDSVQVKTEYMDGLGRPLQTVLRQESPQRRDIVQPQAYDALNRQPRQYLPYTAAGTSADAVGYYPDALREQYGFYRGGANPAVDALTANLPKTGVPFAETAFEPSPLNRPLAQGAAGESWMLSAGHAVTQLERPNNLLAQHDSVFHWQAGYGMDREDLNNLGLYADGELWLQQTSDEQGQRTQTFTNKEGQLVLKQVALPALAPKTDTTWLKTYYVYDDFGRLRAVLPPKAWQLVRHHNGQVTGAGVELLLFRYHYDEQGRLIEKKVPDTEGYAYTVYDELDRPILSQDVAQRGRGEWTATKYDALGRVVLTALVSRPGLSRETLQAQATGAAQLWEAPSATALAGDRGYYTNQAFPALTGTDQLMSVSYYDSYDFNQDGTADVAYDAQYDSRLQASYHAAPDGRVTGQLTHSEVRVLDVAATAPGAWLSTTTFFDEKLRPLQVVSTNARGGQDLATSRYDFAGKALASYTVHQDRDSAAMHAPVTVREVPVYDFAGRLLSSTQQLNDQAPVRLFRNTYNELGQLQRKVLGDSLQTVDYAYNIRGWLTHLNDPDQLAPGDLWGMELSYACGFATPQFNGNIAGQKWRSAVDNVERAYGYRYDGLNRLLQGDFVARVGSGPIASAPWGQERGNYRFWAADYDVNGNLRSLRRNGLLQQATHATARQYGLTDNLRYAYQASGSTPASNRLSRVDDLAPAAPTTTSTPSRPDFQDGTTAGSTQPDYSYDAAGSLTADRNKGITQIRYNHLHLPQAICFATGDSLVFRYSAAGQKVAKLAYAAGKPIVQTDYAGAWQYEKDSLRWLSGSEGRTLYQAAHDPANQVSYSFVQEYTLKDHLGNLRVAFRKGTTSTNFATMEAGQASREEQQFDSASIASSRTLVGTQSGHNGSQYAAKLNAGGTVPKPIGPLKQLAVAKGDTLDVQAFGLYYTAPGSGSWGFSLASFVASLIQPAPAVPTGPDGRGKVRVLPLLSIGLGLAPAVQSLNNQVPNAYLRVLVYTADSVLQVEQCRLVRLSTAAQDSYEELTQRVVLQQAGYVQVYVANESPTDVYFDDLLVTHRQGLQVQENHYDPFGLDLVGLSRGATPENKYTFNGKERQDEFGLNWHDHGWRFYDPALGRWVVSDPDAEEGDQESWGTYQFGLDNAVRYNDLDGRLAGPGDGVLSPPGFWQQAGAVLVAAGETIIAAAATPEVLVVGAVVVAAGAGVLAYRGAEMGGGRPPYMSGMDNGPVVKKGYDYGTPTTSAKDANGRVDIAVQRKKIPAADDKGRTGKQERLKELAKDDKLGSADKGWIKQEQNSVARGSRKTIRNPPGKDLAHERGREAAKGYSYKHSNLQDRKLHRTQHKYDDNGRANTERPVSN